MSTNSTAKKGIRSNDQQEASARAFQRRINDKLIEFLGDGSDPNLSPFSVWLDAYSSAIRVNFIIFNDDEIIAL